jgi:hypothetical protein
MVLESSASMRDGEIPPATGHHLTTTTSGV